MASRWDGRRVRTWEAYTDGSGAHGAEGWGFVIVAKCCDGSTAVVGSARGPLPHVHDPDSGQSLGEPTNNVAELTAAITAIAWLTTAVATWGGRCVICHDNLLVGAAIDATCYLGIVSACCQAQTHGFAQHGPCEGSHSQSVE